MEVEVLPSRQVPGHSLAIQIQDASQVGEARRAVSYLAHRLRLDDEIVGKLGLITTELSTNLLKHAGGGEIVFQSFGDELDGFEVIALDKGPGIRDWRRAFEDGYSTVGTSGNGLGAVARIASEHFAYAAPQKGTIIVTRLRKSAIRANEENFEIGAINIPMHGEDECGDSWTFLHTKQGFRAVVADGLGHGPLAAKASQAALVVARHCPDLDPSALLGTMHESLNSTRGAAVAVADLDRDRGILRFAGLGNIAASILTDGTKRQLVSHNGTAGLQVRRVQEFTYPWATSSVLVMHSDGLGTHWSTDAYPGILQQHVSVLGAALYRDFSRGRDDVTVLTIRERGGAS